ncbi:MAG: hypothetical protein WKF41_08905 [Gaiellaceae bacterium]
MSHFVQLAMNASPVWSFASGYAASARSRPAVESAWTSVGLVQPGAAPG